LVDTVINILIERNSMKRKLLYSLLIVLAWLGFLVEGSHALFSASTTLTGNTINTGTVELQISNAQTGGSTAAFAASAQGFAYNLNPGSNDMRFMYLKNTSQINAAMDITVLANTNVVNNEFFNAVTMEFAPVDESGASTGTPVSVTLNSLANAQIPLGVSIPQGASQRIRVKTALSSGYARQSQSIAYDLTFNGSQHYVPSS
jgi:hypothetical protein